jgi:dTDP-4-dehydrorhamnose reductase
VKILLTGRAGQLGRELELVLAPLGEVVATERATLDLADFDAIRRVVRDAKPNVIVNAAAYTAVDKAESEPELAMRINGEAPGVLAEEAKRLDALLVHYSTDYVFDGTSSSPYSESDKPNPLNVYGHSKLRGENAVQDLGGRHLILRTSWVYGLHGRNFLLTMLNAARAGNVLRVVSDQRGTPTWSATIADATGRALRVQKDDAAVQGLLHLCSAGDTTWHGFAEEIFRLWNLYPDLRAICSSEYATSAKRPMDSRLSNERFSKRFGALPSWEVALAACAARSKGATAG